VVSEANHQPGRKVGATSRSFEPLKSLWQQLHRARRLWLKAARIKSGSVADAAGCVNFAGRATCLGFPSKMDRAGTNKRFLSGGRIAPRWGLPYT
jgi:hypothetical protein